MARLGDHHAATKPPILWQFRLSHFNEKARWALDYKGVAHARQSLLPGFHVPRMWALSGQKQVPVLVYQGRAIAGSAAVIDAIEEAHPDPPLYPAVPSERQRALELAQYFDDRLGPHIRRALFYEILPDPGYSTALLADGFSVTVRALYRLVFPALRAVMRRDMQIDDESARESLDQTRVVLSRLGNQIQSSGYLVGSRFTVADLTAAALVSPVFQPPQFSYRFPAATEAVERFREKVGHESVGEWCRTIYARHRGASAARDRNE
jgi:glutathione S-transferase